MPRGIDRARIRLQQRADDVGGQSRLERHAARPEEHRDLPERRTGTDDADEERDDLPPAIGVVIAELISQPAADEGSQCTQDDCHDDADALLARHDQPCERTDDQTDD